MKLADFEFDLPERLIAQHPLAERDASRLMVLDRASGTVSHKAFKDLSLYIHEGDVIVINNTKVIPTRVAAKKPTGGRLELLLVRRLFEDADVERWSCLAKPTKGLKKGLIIEIENGTAAEIDGIDSEGLVICTFKKPFDLERIGSMPLPPYIKRKAAPEDAQRYQTVFAGVDGAVAAPTAGLHFTDATLEGLRNKGVIICQITLHTGPGTFMPVRVEEIEGHKMMRERYSITPEVFATIAKARKEGRRVVAVGTTTTRALESCLLNGLDQPLLDGDTDLFIYPGFHFKAVDALLTNFHLPGSTLIMLASAFGGYDLVMRAYKEAVMEGYRFFSYGDAMFIC